MPSSSRLRGSCGPQRAVTGTPMSERQQMALVMQMTSQANASNTVVNNNSHGTPRSRDRNERGETPLHIAAIKGDHEKVKKILDQGTDPNVTDFAGWTPLHEACSNGWLKIAIMLIEAGANVNAHGFENDTPLHDAASNGQINLVKYLLQSGANPHLKNSKGKMPFDVAKPPTDEILADISKENTPNQKASHGNRSRDDSKKTSSSSSEETSTSAACSTSNMETVNKVSEDKTENKETPAATNTEKSLASTTTAVVKPEGESNATNSSSTPATQEEPTSANTSAKRLFAETESTDGDNTEDEATKRKKRKEAEPVKEAAKPVQQNRTNVGRSGLISGTKPPGPASKTGVAPLSKGGGPLSSNANKTNTSCTNQKLTSTHASSNQSKTSGSSTGTPGKSNSVQSNQSGKSGTGNQSKGQNSSLSVAQVNVKGAPDKKSPCASPKAFVQKSDDGDSEDTKVDGGGLKVPPLKIVIPGGVGGAGSSSNQQEGDGGSTQRGNAKNRSNTATLPYIIHVGDNADANDDEKRSSGSDDKSNASAQRVLRSHRNNDGEREKDRGRSSPHVSTPCSPSGAPVPTKTPPPYHSRQSPDNVIFDTPAIPSTSGTSSNSNSGSGSSSSQGTPVVELHPRKRKLKASRDSHQSASSSSSHQSSNEGTSGESSNTYNPHANPYQQYLNIRKQVERKQKGLFPVQPKPPQGFKDYLINRCSYVLKSNDKQQPIVNPPSTVPLQMREVFVLQENERHALRVQHLVEKEKLVLAVELEILRVHGKAARALANQSLPFSVCTLLMDHEVYNIQTPEQEEKERNAQRSRYNGRLFLSWLQDVDDKWEKIKEAMVRRHHTEAESLHATQSLSWEWKLKELGICEYKITPSIDLSHVPMVHVLDDFDLLPA